MHVVVVTLVVVFFLGFINNYERGAINTAAQRTRVSTFCLSIAAVVGAGAGAKRFYLKLSEQRTKVSIKLVDDGALFGYPSLPCPYTRH